MHQSRAFNPDITVFDGALHAYASIATANYASKALDVVVLDDEDESESGPALHRASTYKFWPRKRVWSRVIKIEELYRRYNIDITSLWRFPRTG